MNYKPQILPYLPKLVLPGAFALAAITLTLANPAVPADEPDSAAATAADEGETPSERPATGSSDESADSAGTKGLPAADQILTQLRAKLEGLDSLKCDLHQTALFSGMKLTAVGKYVEASGNRVNLRYVIFPMTAETQEDAGQLALDADVETPDESRNRGILIQVSDGTVLSTFWKNGETQRVIRRNIRDILAAAQETAAYDPKNAAMDLGVGGVRGLISRLQTTMEFAPVKSIKVGDRKVYEVTGRWNEKIRKEVFRIPANSLIDPRPQVPEYVRVYVDAETMLPRRIQFLKRSMSPQEKMVRPLITLDFRNMVLNDAVDQETFVFQTPKDASEDDQTEQVIEMIRESLQPVTAPAPAAPEPEE